MPKVQVKKQSVSLDMTAMCDVAFLLLTFFMLTAKMKPQEPVQVLTPTSQAMEQKKIENQAIITVSKAGEAFFTIENPEIREKVLEAVAGKAGMKFSPAESKAFKNMEGFGVPLSQLKNLINTEPGMRNMPGLQKGIPKDSVNNELFEWLFFTRGYGNIKGTKEGEVNVVVKGDGASDYKNMKQIIATLQRQKVNSFKLLTGLENEATE
jgi:biopolymer transport protein ExbD